MKKSVLALVILFSCYCIKAQEVTYFSRLFDYQNLWQDVSVVRQLPSGEFLAVGRTLGGQISDNKVFLIWLTPQGDTIQTRFFQVDSTALYLAKSGMHVFPDESFVFGGTYSNEYEGIVDFYLAKFDALGDTLWFRHYEASLSDICRSVKFTSDGGFVLAGKSRSFGDPEFGNFHLMKTDSVGNIEWQNSYGISGVSEDASSVTITPEGDYILSGLKGEPGSPETEIRVMKITRGGSLVWQKSFGGAANSDAYNVINSLDDGNFLIVGSIGFGPERDAYLAKIDGDGNLLWEKTYPSEYSTYFGQSLELKNGNIVILGQTYFYNQDINYHYQKSNISNLTSEGEEIWKRYLFTREDRQNYLFDLIRTADGGFLAGGFALSDTSVRSDAWVVKMDSLGCAVQNCELVGLHDDNQIEENSVVLKVYPNPFSNETNVDFYLHQTFKTLNLEIHDNTGKLLSKTTLEAKQGWNTLHLNGESLSTGLFLVSLTTDEGVIALQKLIRSH